MLNTVKLNHTVWYDGREKILRLSMQDFLEHHGVTLDLSSDPNDIDIIKIHSITKSIMTFGDIPADMLYFGSESENTSPKLADSINIVYNENEKSIDIHFLPDEKFNNDGEIVIDLSYKVYTGKKSNYEETSTLHNYKHELKLVIPFSSSEKKSSIINYFEQPKVTKAALRDSHTYIPNSDNVVYTFELIDLNITDQFATYGDVKEMIETLAAANSTDGNSDMFTIELEGDLLVLTKENDRSYRRIIDLSRYHDTVTGQPLNMDTVKNDILFEVNKTLNERIPEGYSLGKLITEFEENRADRQTFISKFFTSASDSTNGNFEFEKEDESYKLKHYVGGNPTTLLTIPFSSLREIPQISENSIKPVTDKLYYSKSEVDQMIQQLHAELTAARSTTSEQPQQ